MDNSRSSSIYYRGVTPKKSPTAEKVQQRRLDIRRSETAAYWALFNTSVAMLLYYDLTYLHSLDDISVLLVYFEWLICSLFIVSACYDFIVHFWPMKPIVISPHDKSLLGLQDDEIGFRIEEPPPQKFEPVYDELPPFEISFEEEKVVLPPNLKNRSKL